MKKESNQFDIIVIGAGSGGLNVAGFMNRIGKRVLLIDKKDESIGGDCLNHGCIPSKALIHVAREVHAGKSAHQFGLTVQGYVDIQKVMAYVKGKQSIIREHENAEHFQRLGITVALGNAVLSGHNSVTVNGQEYSAQKIVLATGSRPRTLELEGSDQISVYTNETVFDMKVLPRRFVFIGGGPISLELGQAFAMLGSDVTIVHGGERLLEKEVKAVSAFMQAELKAMGIKIILNAKLKKFERGELVVTTKDTAEFRVGADALFAGIGRVLNIEHLGLEQAGVTLSPDKQKIVVDEHLRTTNKNVYVVGDVAGGLQFTHAAELHASLIIKNFFSPLKQKLNTDSFVSSATESPNVATSGLV